MTLEVFTVKATRKRDKFDLYAEIKKLVKKMEFHLRKETF